MPSLKALLITLASFALPTALAAPITPSTAAPALSKRATYHPSSPPERDDYCGEAVPTYTYGPSAPLAADCQGMPQAYPGPGYWTVSAAETNAAPDGWIRLVASGTCAFEVRWSWTGAAQDYRFGTNDLGFYVRGHANQAEAQDGRVSVKSGVYCSRDGTAEGGMIGLEWRVIHS